MVSWWCSVGTRTKCRLLRQAMCKGLCASTGASLLYRLVLFAKRTVRLGLLSASWSAKSTLALACGLVTLYQ